MSQKNTGQSVSGWQLSRPFRHRKLSGQSDALIGRSFGMWDVPAGPFDGDCGLGRGAKAEMQRTGLSAGMSATDDRALHIAVDGYTRADRMAIALAPRTYRREIEILKVANY